jgi:hypothetical protein
MSIGNGNKKANGAAVARATKLRFERARLIVTLSDAREISVPLSWYPTLQRASPNARRRWTILGPGLSFHWPALDLDLSVAGLIHGLPELIPRPPRLGRLAAMTKPPRRRSTTTRKLS